jgi:hypothetical protein
MTDGLDVLVHEVIAAIVTAPCVMLAFDLSLMSALAFSFLPAKPKPRSSGLFLSERWNSLCMSLSVTRSCGRFGPARLGTIVDMSSETFDENVGVGASAVQNKPCAR